MNLAQVARHAAVMLIAVLAPAGAAIPASQAALSMVTGSVTSQPIGHYEFCRRMPEECTFKSRSAPAARLDVEAWEIVRMVNRTVNERYIARTDMEAYGVEEYWTYPTVFADCEDYALQKRKELSRLGFSLSNLLITVVRKPDGEGHAVLTLRTSEGDFILDNLSEEVSLWYETPYTFLKRQSSVNTGRWVTIENGRDLLVGALR